MRDIGVPCVAPAMNNVAPANGTKAAIGRSLARVVPGKWSEASCADTARAL